jgi:hypothetical protein
MRIAPDGGATIVDDGRPQPAELRARLGEMAGTGPGHPVAGGASWSGTLTLPRTGGAVAGGGGGSMTATFHFDSLSRGGDVAHVSMRGALGTGGSAGEGARGGDQRGAARVEMSGVVTGTMAIDRRRGWMTDARTTLTVRALVAPPAGTAGQPTEVRLRMTQWLRTR